MWPSGKWPFLPKGNSACDVAAVNLDKILDDALFLRLFLTLPCIVLFAYRNILLFFVSSIQHFFVKIKRILILSWCYYFSHKEMECLKTKRFLVANAPPACKVL